jgi:hypothetical protein
MRLSGLKVQKIFAIEFALFEKTTENGQKSTRLSGRTKQSSRKYGRVRYGHSRRINSESLLYINKKVTGMRATLLDQYVIYRLINMSSFIGFHMALNILNYDSK